MIRGVVHLLLVAACFYFAGTAHEAGAVRQRIFVLAGAVNSLALLLLWRTRNERGGACALGRR